MDDISRPLPGEPNAESVRPRDRSSAVGDAFDEIAEEALTDLDEDAGTVGEPGDEYEPVEYDASAEPFDFANRFGSAVLDPSGDGSDARSSDEDLPLEEDTAPPVADGEADVTEAAATEADGGAAATDVPPPGVDAPGVAPPPGAAGAEPAEAAPLADPVELSRVLMAVMLTAREPQSLLRLAQACNATQAAVREGLEQLERDLRAHGFPLAVARAGETARLLTVPEVFPYLERLRGVRRAERLSPAALETLAVIAYRQPVMRAEIEAIRGVKAGPMLRTLLEHKLVDVVGRADVPGRPLQYGTTDLFLDRFGLSSIKDLPSVREFKGLG